MAEPAASVLSSSSRNSSSSWKESKFAKAVFAILGIMLTLVTYGVLQEKIMRVPYGVDKEYFKYSLFLVFCNRITTSAVSAAALLASKKALDPVAPVYKYCLVSVSNILTTTCQYEALKYVSFPVQTLAKCAKMIPVMVWGTLIMQKTYKGRDYLLAFLVTLGCSVFILYPAEADISPYSKGRENTVWGVSLMLGYLGFDGFTSTFQDKLFKGYQMEIHNQIFYTTSCSCIISLTGHTFDGFKILLFNYEVTISRGFVFNLAKVCRRSHGCGLWRSINEGWESFAKHLSFVVGDGSRIRFWHDRWIGENTLKDRYPELFVCSADKDACISDVLWVPEGGSVRVWNLRFYRAFEDWELAASFSLLQLIQPCIPRGDRRDTLCWRLKGDGKFNTRSFYHAIRGVSNSLFPWKGVWKPKIPKHVAFFLWTAAHGRILTLDNLMLKGRPLANWCCMCFCDGESVDHILLHCPFALSLWADMLQTFGIHWVMPGSLTGLLSSWHQWLGKHNSDIWNLVPGCIMWSVWLERNRRTFEDKEKTVEELKTLCHRILLEWSRCWGFTECFSLAMFMSSLSLVS